MKVQPKFDGAIKGIVVQTATVNKTMIAHIHWQAA